MDGYLDWFLSTPVVALVVSCAVFIVTLFLVVKRLIGFFITLLLLFFTIVSGYAILNHDIVRHFLKEHYTGEKTADVKDEHSYSNLKEAYDQLKEEFEVQKEKLHKYLEDPTTKEPPATK